MRPRRPDAYHFLCASCPISFLVLLGRSCSRPNARRSVAPDNLRIGRSCEASSNPSQRQCQKKNGDEMTDGALVGVFVFVFSVGRESPTVGVLSGFVPRRILNVGISLIGGEKWTDGGFLPRNCHDPFFSHRNSNNT